MIAVLAVRTLIRRGGRTALAIAGIAVSAALLVDMTMLASGLTRSFGELTRALGYSLRVTPAGTLPFDSEAGIADAASVAERIGAVDGVRAVAPVLGAQLYTVSSDTIGESVFATGIDPSAQMLYVLLEGRDPARGELVVSRPFAEASGLGPGDLLEVAPTVDVALGRPRSASRYRVSGVGDFLYDYAGQRSVAIPMEEVQRLTDRPDEVSLFAVAVAGGADEEAVADRVAAAVGGVSVYSTRELMAAMDRRLAYFRQLSTILGTIALAVAALLVGTIITIGVRERFGEIATLRAIGVSASRLRLSVVVEGTVVTGVGCLLGAPIGWWMAGRLDRILLEFPGIPARVSFFVFDPVSVVAALGSVVMIGAIVGVVPVGGALRASLGQALREEAD